MICPKCQNSGINGLESCPHCGFRIAAEDDDDFNEVKARKRRNGESPGMIEMDYSGHSEEHQEESQGMPEWRLQVTRRLQEIKQKRQSNPGDGATEAAVMPLPFPEPERIPVQSATISLVKEGGNGEKSQPPAGNHADAKLGVFAGQKGISPRPSRKQQLPQNQKPHKEPLPKIKSLSAHDTISSPAGQMMTPPNASEVKNLIDNVVIRSAATPSFQSAAAIPAERRALSLTRYEDKLTLLSRAFSGMVDLIIVALCVGTFIFAIDAFSGIVVVDAFSWIDYCMLFLATYFVYSLFFLGTINQTIGMMITDLRVVDEHEKRPLMRQILGRLTSFVPSLLVLGAGLIWGMFDRESRCLHDRLSGTHVVRI
jgi:uncharacterized RDD family membrane protein YckC